MTFANAMVVTLAMALIVLRIGSSPGACRAQCEERTKNRNQLTHGPPRLSAAERTSLAILPREGGGSNACEAWPPRGNDPPWTEFPVRRPKCGKVRAPIAKNHFTYW